MNNKYYTPSIEEFHVGFECEILDRGNNTWNNIILTYEILSQVLVFPLLNKHQGFLSYIERELNENNIRVKYLDKEDIEDLGFLVKVETKFGIIFSNQLYSIILSKMKLNHIEVYLTQPYINESDGLTFSGTIKNKSELKVLLKQLNIS